MTAPYAGSKWVISGALAGPEATEMISCDPNLARILNATARHFELEQFARLELTHGGRAWVTATALERSRGKRSPAARIRAGVAAFVAIFR